MASLAHGHYPSPGIMVEVRQVQVPAGLERIGGQPLVAVMTPAAVQRVTLVEAVLELVVYAVVLLHVAFKHGSCHSSSPGGDRPVTDTPMNLVDTGRMLTGRSDGNAAIERYL